MEKKNNNPAKGVTWDLSDLYRSGRSKKFREDIKSVLKKAARFNKKYHNKISDKMTSSGMLRICKEYENIVETISKAYCFAMLKHSADTSDPANGALLQHVREEYSKVQKLIIFFELKWAKLSTKKAKEIMNSPLLTRYRHYLEIERKFKPYRLSEPEEKILTEKATTGSLAFSRLFDEVINSIQFPFTYKGKKKKLNEPEILAKLYSFQRGERKAAAQGLTSGLKENSSVLHFIFNNLVYDHAIDDRLRTFKEPISSRNLSNEVSDEIVETMMRSCEAYYPVVRNYYSMKRRILRLETLYDYDRYAPLKEPQETISYRECRDIILEAYYGFSEVFGTIAERFFSHSWIDAELRKGKMGGAFSASTVPSVHPYILVNYTGRRRDVMTVAHELGHGIHQYLARKNGILQQDTPLIIAEMASTFGEMLVFYQLLEKEKNNKNKLNLVCSKLEDNFATIFRQVVMTRFEQALHDNRRTKGELPLNTVNKLWIDANKAMFGKSVILTGDYAYWWLYIPHFIHTPFYCYAYAFAQLVVLSLFNKYREQGDFSKKYIEILEKGGSESPERLLKQVGCNIKSDQFWIDGLKELKLLLKKAKALLK